jgi:tetratricopeptide (TPR) repeat protein
MTQPKNTECKKGSFMDETDPARHRLKREVEMIEKENEIENLFDRGVGNFNYDRYDEAIKDFTEVLELNPDHPDALYYRGMAWAHKKNFGRAIEDFTEAVKKNPNDADSFVARGEAWQSRGKIHKALNDFKQALQIDPDNTDYKKLVRDMKEKLRQALS